MQRFEVLLDNVASGFVEALDARQALEVAYKDPAYTQRLAARQVLSLRRDSAYGMHILIDTTNNRAIARHDSYKALAALALIQFNNVDTVIIRSGENKSYSVFEGKQLEAIAASIGCALPSGAYSAKLKAVRAALEGADFLQLPYPAAQLEAQAYALGPKMDKPMAFNPEGEEPKPLKKWHFEPQRNRAREDSPHWHAFAAGLGHGPGVVTPETRAHLLGEAPQPRKAPPAPSRARRSASGEGAATTPKAPRAPRAPGAPAARPAAGTKTGLVWEIADRVREQHPELSGKDLRKKITEECQAAELAAGTINVQYGKWKSSNGL